MIGGFVDKFIGDSIMCIFAQDDLTEQGTWLSPTSPDYF